MFAVDSRTETFLTSLGVRFSYDDDLRIKDLMQGWHCNNLGRSQDVIETAVLEYSELMQQQSPAPAPIVMFVEDKLAVLDGVQRLLAAELIGSTKFCGYVIETSSKSMIKTIRVMSNPRLNGGYAETKEWSLGVAVQLLVIEESMSHEEVAKLGGWSVSQIRNKHRVLECRMRIRGVGATDSLSDKMVKTIDSYSVPDDFVAASQPICEFVEDVSRVFKSADDAQPYVKEFFNVSRNKPRLYEQFVNKHQEFRSEPFIQTQLGNGVDKALAVYTPDGKLLRAIKAAVTTAKNVLEEGTPIAGEIETYYQLTTQLKSVLQKIGRRGQNGRG